MRRLGDLLDDEGDLLLAHRAIALPSGARDISLGDDAQASAPGIDDRDAADLELRHLALDIPEIVVRGGSHRARRHQLGDLRVRTPAGGNGPYGEVPVGDDSNDATRIIDDRHYPAIAVAHDFCRATRSVFPAATLRVSRHNVSGSHQSAPSGVVKPRRSLAAVSVLLR